MSMNQIDRNNKKAQVVYHGKFLIHTVGCLVGGEVANSFGDLDIVGRSVGVTLGLILGKSLGLSNGAELNDGAADGWYNGVGLAELVGDVEGISV